MNLDGKTCYILQRSVYAEWFRCKATYIVTAEKTSFSRDDTFIFKEISTDIYSIRTTEQTPRYIEADSGNKVGLDDDDSSEDTHWKVVKEGVNVFFKSVSKDKYLVAPRSNYEHIRLVNK